MGEMTHTEKVLDAMRAYNANRPQAAMFDHQLVEMTGLSLAAVTRVLRRELSSGALAGRASVPPAVEQIERDGRADQSWQSPRRYWLVA